MSAPSPYRAFTEHLRALRARLEREHRAATGAEYAQLRELWEAGDSAYVPVSSAGGFTHFGARPPSWDLLEVEFAPAANETAGAPRHRPPEGLPTETVRRLEEELVRRREQGNPRVGGLTQAAIAGRLGLDRHRVQQAEGLLAAGWPLPRSHPDFSANDGCVRWPSVREAAQILALERPAPDAG